jgi:hypothetical protein
LIAAALGGAVEPLLYDLEPSSCSHQYLLHDRLAGPDEGAG